MLGQFCIDCSTSFAILHSYYIVLHDVHLSSTVIDRCRELHIHMLVYIIYIHMYIHIFVCFYLYIYGHIYIYFYTYILKERERAAKHAHLFAHRSCILRAWRPLLATIGVGRITHSIPPYSLRAPL